MPRVKQSKTPEGRGVSFLLFLRPCLIKTVLKLFVQWVGSLLSLLRRRPCLEQNSPETPGYLSSHPDPILPGAKQSWNYRKNGLELFSRCFDLARSKTILNLLAERVGSLSRCSDLFWSKQYRLDLFFFYLTLLGVNPSLNHWLDGLKLSSSCS